MNTSSSLRVSAISPRRARCKLARNGILLTLLCLLPFGAQASAAPELRAASTASTDQTSASLTIGVPAGVSGGDVMLAAIDARVGSSAPIKAPPGWTLVRRDVHTPGEASLSQAVYYRVAQTGETPSYTWAFANPVGAAGGIVAYRGVDAQTPIDTHSGRYNGSTGVISAPSVTPSVPNTLVVGFFGTNGRKAAAAPPGMGRRYAVSTTGGVGDFLPASDPAATASSASADLGRTTTDATGDLVAALDSHKGSGIGQLVVLRPASGSSPSPIPVPPPPAPAPKPPPTPDVPTPVGLSTVSSDTTSITVKWRLPVAQAEVLPDWSELSYDLSRDGTLVANTRKLRYTVAGLVCGRTYTLGVTSRDPQGQLSSETQATTSTAACPAPQPPQPPPPPPPPPAPGPAPPAVGSSKGIWLGPAEIASLPMSGSAWTNVKKTADGSLGSPHLSDMSSLHDTSTLAVALVYARTGDVAYRRKAATAILGAMGTETLSPNGHPVLALGRNLVSYVIAADLISLRDFDPAADELFRRWLTGIRTTRIDGESMVEAHEARASNWGTVQGASRIAADLYLGDSADLARAVRVFKGWLGDRTSYSSFGYPSGSETFVANPSEMRPLSPKGATKNGYNVDGMLPADWIRCGTFKPGPCYTNYTWGGLQGAVVQAVLLHRAGHPAFEWQDQAIRRAYQRLYDESQRDPAFWEEAREGDDSWQPWLANYYYGTSYPAVTPTRPGKVMGWTDWTHASER